MIQNAFIVDLVHCLVLGCSFVCVSRVYGCPNMDSRRLLQWILARCRVREGSSGAFDFTLITHISQLLQHNLPIVISEKDFHDARISSATL